MVREIALVIGSVIAALLALEIGLRAIVSPPQTVEVAELVRATPGSSAKQEVEETQTHNSVIVWGGPHGSRLRKNVRAKIHDHSLNDRDVIIETNSIGLRYGELGPKQPGEYRVLVLGDSITFGDYVAADEVYTARLEELAAARGRNIRFINAGLPGSGTSEEFYRYMELRDYAEPDLVLVQMYLNDSQNSEIFRARALPDPLSRSRLLSVLTARFEIVRAQLWKESAIPPLIAPDWREAFRNGRDLHSGDMLHSRDGFDFEIYNAHRDFGLAWNDASWTIIERILRVWRQALSETPARMAVVLFPVHIQVLGTVEDYRPQEACRLMCRRLGIPFHDPVPALRADWQARRQRLFYDHCHPTPHGFEVIAQDLLEWLTTEGLIP